MYIRCKADHVARLRESTCRAKLFKVLGCYLSKLIVLNALKAKI